MVASHFLHTVQVERLLSYEPPHLVEIALALRDLVAELAPDATERRLRLGLGYHDAARGGPVSAGICQILIMDDHVRLAFIHGAFLSDPHALLRGEPRFKKYARIDTFESAPWEDLRQLISESARFDPYRPGETAFR